MKYLYTVIPGAKKRKFHFLLYLWSKIKLDHLKKKKSLCCSASFPATVDRVGTGLRGKMPSFIVQDREEVSGKPRSCSEVENHNLRLT